MSKNQQKYGRFFKIGMDELVYGMMDDCSHTILEQKISNKIRHKDQQKNAKIWHQNMGLV